MRKATDQRDAQTISLLGTSLLLFHGGDVTCFDACHVIWCGGHSTIFQRGSCIWSAGSVELLIYCSLQVLNGTNLTKYCACHEKWISWLWSASHMKRPVKRYLQCAEQHWLPSNISKYCACHEILTSRCLRKIPRIASANIKTIRPWSEDNPKIKSSSRTRRLGDLTRPIFKAHFVWKNATFRAPAIYQNFTKCCACHEKWHSNFTKYCACHEKCTLLFSSLLSTHLFSLGIYSL